jgi:hypothetical protein
MLVKTILCRTGNFLCDLVYVCSSACTALLVDEGEYGFCTEKCTSQ